MQKRLKRIFLQNPKLRKFKDYNGTVANKKNNQRENDSLEMYIYI